MQTNIVLFSIVVPVFCVEKYLPKCLDSILIYDGLDLEVICAYDEGHDRSVEILEEYNKIDSRIKLVKCRGKGLSGARNDGISMASGEIIWFVDADDFIAENAINKIIEAYKKDSFDIFVMGTKYEPKGSRVSSFITDSLYTRNVEYDKFHHNALFRECGAKPFVWRNCYRLMFLKESKILFDEDNLIGEDLAFQMELFPKAEKIIFRSEKLYNYQWLREGSLQNTYMNNKKKQLYGHVRIVKHVVNNWEKEGYNKELWTELYKWSIDFLGEEIPAYGNLELKCEAKQIITKIGAVSDKKIPGFYQNILRSFDDSDTVNHNSIIYKLQHSYYSRGFVRMMYLMINRIRRSKQK